MGRPSKCQEVKAGLLRIINGKRKEHDLLLPGERELAGMIGVSRSTVRKVLDEFEHEGIVSRDNQMTRCLPLKRQRGRYAFCAASGKDCRNFYFELYHLFWEIFSSRAGELEIELIFIPQFWDQGVQKQLEELKKYDLVFVSYIAGDVVRQMAESGIALVMLDEQNRMENYPFVGLDNTAVGHLAAQVLLRAGCRNALLAEFCMGGRYFPFEARRRGFTVEFEKNGGKVTWVANDQESPNPLVCLNSLAQKMEPGLQEDIDCIFYLSDEKSDLLNWPWFHSRRIPQDLKMLAFLGSGELYRNHILPDRIVMDHVAIADILLYMIELFEKHHVLPRAEQYLIAPVYQPGETIFTLQQGDSAE